ncbi:Sm domain-containing protein [Haematococcus lacustris]|uniref:Sm domain-containing protein n=1 Tax=Haematococcus lacustris TaxID=44745 RepID=A0A6A0AAK4_HAELA|nr:Sm domain-containing protein [Haematococcus lacustris]
MTSKKESALDLSKFIDKGVRVKLAGGREVSGVLKGYDQLLNLVLDEALEYLRDPLDPTQLTDKTRVQRHGCDVSSSHSRYGFAQEQPFPGRGGSRSRMTSVLVGANGRQCVCINGGSFCSLGSPDMALPGDVILALQGPRKATAELAMSRE